MSDRRILVFGASAHVGMPLARHLERTDARVTLRLATSNAAKAAMLRSAFPRAETAVASYHDLDALVAVLRGVHGVFVITPDFFDELVGMERLVAAIRRAPTVDHVVRILADTPGMTLERLPRDLRNLGPGPAVQHFEARAVLNASGLPVTYLNSAGYYMDDFLIHFAPPLRTRRTLVVPYERRMCFTDTTDLGEVAARLLSEGPERHAGQYYHFNSGEAARTFASVAELMSEVTGTRVAYDPSPDAFLRELGPVLRSLTGDDRAARYFLVNWQMERDHESAFVGSAFGAKILGRAPTTLRSWLEQNRERLLAA